ncbi:MAG: hypothetical protein M1136_03225 [Chloroflexi bacterium]|nr:hypothetical protein [Chloroflexota bacterium]
MGHYFMSPISTGKVKEGWKCPYCGLEMCGKVEEVELAAAMHKCEYGAASMMSKHD